MLYSVPKKTTKKIIIRFGLGYDLLSMGLYSQPIGPQYLPTYTALGLYNAGLGAASANFSSII
jgi:hypothetical protein